MAFDLVGGPHDGKRAMLPPGWSRLRVFIVNRTPGGAHLPTGGGAYLPSPRLGDRGKLFWRPDPPEDSGGP